MLDGADLAVLGETGLEGHHWEVAKAIQFRVAMRSDEVVQPSREASQNGHAPIVARTTSWTEKFAGRTSASTRERRRMR